MVPDVNGESFANRRDLPEVRADRLAPGVEEPGWVRRSAGDGAKGPRVYDWARVEIRPLNAAGPVIAKPVDTTLEELVRFGPSKNALRRPRERWGCCALAVSGARRWNKEVRGKRGLSQLGRKADTPDGARGPAVALPADMETSIRATARR